MAIEVIGRDIYLRHTTPEGSSYVQEHRVWDAERFIASEQRAVEKVNAEQRGDAPRKAAVQQITREQYLKERTK